MDIYDLADKIENDPLITYASLKSAAGALKSAVTGCVIANKTGANHLSAGGISINFPRTSESWFEINNPQSDDFYSQLKFARASNWKYFLDTYYSNSIVNSNTLFYVVSAPNPYNPGAGRRLSIRNFPDNSHIRLKIYDLRGNPVRSLEADGELIEWDGTNDNGSTVASGMYFYVAKTALGSCKGKITVVKK
jgi:hypothetical protein